MYVTPGNLWILLASGATTGVLGAILGTGGGVFLIPMLVLALGVPMHYAIGASLVSVIATSCAVASANVERGTANMRLGMVLEIATATGAIAGGLGAAHLAARTLELLFGALLVPTAYLMWRGRGSAAGRTGDADEATPMEDDVRDTGALGGRFIDEPGHRPVAYRVRRLWAGLGVSFVAGSVSGLLGIGGGTFKVPALHLLCGVPIKAAAATSNFMIGVTAAASGFLYYGRGEVRPGLTAAVVLGVVAGSALGSILNRHIEGRRVRQLFAVLLAAVAVQMIYRSATGGT